MAELTSIWGSLSEHLIASFWEVKRDGSRVDEDVTVWAPLINDPQLDIQQNWQSPWENIGQSSLPTLQQMLQSGALQPLAKIIDNKAGTTLSSAASTVEGRSSVSKLNSIQVWTGSPPVKITATLLFRAWKDSIREVEKPFEQLMSWALPVHLEGDATILSNALDGNVSKDTVFPSTVPVLLAMKYKGRTYSPLVIESIGVPLGSPIDKAGKFVELSIPVTLCSITSVDRGDWLKYSNNQ
jgi:hypothetical protein